MPNYPGQIPGIGANGPYGGDFTAGVDLGYFSGFNPSAGLTFPLPGDPSQYPLPPGVSLSPFPDPGEAPQPTPGGTPNPGYNNPSVPNEPAPLPGDEGDTEGPPSSPDLPGPPVLYEPGPPVLYEPGPPPSTYYAGQPKRQPSTPPITPSPHRPATFPPRFPANDPFPGPAPRRGNPVLEPFPYPLPLEVFPLFPLILKTMLPPLPSTVPYPIQKLPPPQLPPPPPPPSGPRPIEPKRPSLPRIPIPPTVSTPEPEVPKWPAQPVYSPLPVPSPAPQTIPSSVPTSTSSTPSASPSTSSTPSASPATRPVFQLAPLLGGLLNPFFGPHRAPSVTAAPSAATFTPPQPSIPTNSTPSAPGIATQVPSPGLTPSSSPGVESPPAGASCETPSQTKQRRQRQRDACEKFITITIPKHKRRVCAAEAGRYIGRKLGRKLGSLAGREVRGLLKKAGLPLAKLPKRKRIPRSIEIGGGVGIELPRMPGGR